METNPETDAIVRRLRGYSRVYEDPPEQEGTTLEATRHRMGLLIVQGFADLDKRLRNGEPIPEQWTGSLGYEYRTRYYAGKHVFIYPPGCVGPAPCNYEFTGRSHGCKWLNPRADRTACARCHTIRIKVA